jgi:hypothetical protein
MWMIKAKLNLCLICLASIGIAGAEPNGIEAATVWKNNRDYTFIWWAYGLRDPSRVFHIQTSHYGLSFDFDDFELNTFGPIVNPASEEDVLYQDNTLIESLDRAALQCVVEYDGYRYEATGAGPAWTDCMLVESGKFFQRCWLERLSFSGSGRRRTLSTHSSLEISAWPDRIALALYVKPDTTIRNGALEINFDVADVYATLLHEGRVSGLVDPSGRGFVFLADTPEATIICDVNQTNCTVRLDTGETWIAGTERSVGIIIYPVSREDCDALQEVVRHESMPLAITAYQVKPLVEVLPTYYDTRHGWITVGLRNDQCADYQKSGNDRMEEVALRLANTDDQARQVRLNFAKEGRVCSVTGLSAILCDEERNPLGIPIQLSKNWHTQKPGHRFASTWYHGLTMITVPPRTTLNLMYRSVNGHWGGVAAASHAQLCLIGWGSHQLWNQSALGAWGESICFEPDQGQVGGAVLDTRPLMVGAPWRWTNNVGGADFLVYYNELNRKQWNSRMRTMYRRYCPNLTEVTYSGRTADKKIDLQYTVGIFRTDDIVRGIYRFRYDIRETVDFQRLVLFQCGGDDYSYTSERLFACGNERGLVREWQTQWGGDTYRTQPLELKGRIPWLSMHEAVPRETGQTTANRGLIIRQWSAVLGGQSAEPWIAERGAKVRGVDTSLIDILAPSDVNQLLPGDYVEGEIHHIIMPQFASDYYGPNKQLAAALKKNENTWKMIYREAVGNDLDITVTQGTLRHAYPLYIHAPEGAAFEVSGGLGYVPMTFGGLPDYRGYRLQKYVDEAWAEVDQSVHGCDFWQTDYENRTRTWEMTYTVNLDRLNDERIPTVYRFSKKME